MSSLRLYTISSKGQILGPVARLLVAGLISLSGVGKSRSKARAWDRALAGLSL
jgi:hypothetical protein